MNPHSSLTHHCTKVGRFREQTTIVDSHEDDFSHLLWPGILTFSNIKLKPMSD